MGIINLVMAYLLTFAVFLVVDLFWLGVVAKPIYQKFLGEFLAESPNWKAAFLFYSLYVVGVMIFAVMPGIEKESAIRAIIMGAGFGFFAYMTYELTNLAVLKDWPVGIVYIDILWGIVLTAVTAGVGFYVTRWLV